MNKLEKITLFKVSIIVVSRMFGLFAIFPVFSIYAQQYQYSSAWLIGLSLGVYGLAQALCQIPFGLLSDKYGRKPMLIIGLLLFLGGSLICAFADNIYTIIFGRTLQGLGAVSSVLLALIADTVDEKHRTTANGIIGFQIGATFIIAILVAPIITNSAGIQGLFWLITALAFVSLVISFTLPSHSNSAIIKKRYTLNLSIFKSIIKWPLLRLNISIFLLHSVMTSMFVCLPLYWLEDNISAISNHWQIYLPVMIVSFILMIPFIFFIERRTRINLPFHIAMLLIAIACFAFYYYTNSYWLSLILLTVFFTGFNTLEAVIPSLVAKNSDKNKYGLTMGFHSSMQFLGAFFGGTLGGFLLENFGRNSVFLTNTLMILAWLFLSALYKGAHKNGWH